MSNEFWESEELSSDPMDEQNDELDNLDEYLLDEEEVMYKANEENFNKEVEDDSELLNNARLRLEQGKLYEMLLKHDLFGTVEADPRAISNVQKEIKNFIKERLEILLGLKPDPLLNPQINMPESPFNPLEVELLKRFVAKMSKGATVKAELSPIVSTQSKNSQTIKPLSSAQSNHSVVRQVSNKKVKEPPSALNISNNKVKKILEEKFGENETPLGKPASQMKRSELIERNKRIALRQAARKASSPMHLPPVSPDQELAIMMEHTRARNESLQQNGANPLSLAVTKVLLDANKGE